MRKHLRNLLTVFLVACCALVLVPAVNARAEQPYDGNVPVEAAETWDTYSDTWALTDALGRQAGDYETVGGVSGDKQVGIFYLLWHDSLMEIAESADENAPRNISQIIDNSPDKWLTDSSLYGPESSMHYWGEPLYGYYDLSEDDWVVRAHATQLVDAGVDYIMCDMTNFFSSGAYNAAESNEKTMKNICKVYRQMRSEGLKTPDISMLFTWKPVDCAQAIAWCYDSFIKDNLDLWYNYDGKPLLFGSDANVRSDLKEIFNFRAVAANYDASNSWQWLSNYPQSYVKGPDETATVMTVGVAQNWTDGLSEFTNINEYGQFIARGRSWTSESSRLLTNPNDPEYHSEYGFNFQEQFNRALEIDPDMLIVTEWNEWIAGRFFNEFGEAAGDGLPNHANFVDGFSVEFSRDIEMTREGNLKDNFYNQLAENIRKYKGVRKAPDYKQIKTISAMSDWDSVPAYYRDTLNDAANRDAAGVVSKLHYTNKSGRNDFIQLKVSRDDEKVYFYAECDDDIEGLGSEKFMRLYIKTSGVGGWEGFNYVINKDAVTDGVSSVYKFNNSWDNTVKTGDATVVVEGDKISVAVKLADLGLIKDNVEFEFKWHDNTGVEGDALEFYVSGDCAPNARFNYVYTETPAQKNVPRGAYKYAPADGYEPMTVTRDDVVAQRFTADADFVGVDVAAYNLQNAKASYTLNLYRFDKNYNTTVAADPLTTVTYGNAYDDTRLYTGARLIEKGEYLLTVSGVESAAANTVGLYYAEGLTNGGLYVNSGYAPDMGLKLRLFYADSAAVDASPTFAENDGVKTVTVTFDKVQFISGVSLMPDVENGIAKNFPKNFKIYVSGDGQNYKLAHMQNYKDYYATPAEQVLSFCGSYKSVKVEYEGEIADMKVLSPLAAASRADDTDDKKSSGCGGDIGVQTVAGGV